MDCNGSLVGGNYGLGMPGWNCLVMNLVTVVIIQNKRLGMYRC